jgi:hypothetical protein
MFGRSLFRVIAALAVVALVVLIGFGIYNAGVSEGMAEAGRQAVASGAPAPVYAYPGPYAGHWGFGFGFFGIIFWIVGIFLVFALLRAAFGWGRWRGGPGYGYGHDHGWGGPGGPGGRLEDWHRRAHESESGASKPGAKPGGQPAP